MWLDPRVQIYLDSVSLLLTLPSVGFIFDGSYSYDGPRQLQTYALGSHSTQQIAFHLVMIGQNGVMSLLSSQLLRLRGGMVKIGNQFTETKVVA